MAALGSAVGLGNLWSFPYKMGLGGGFAFLVIYLVLLVTVGYPLLLAEIAVGRKSQKAAIEAYHEVNPKFKFNGVLQTAVPFFLIAFYCTFGGYIMKYLVYSVMAFGGKSVDPEAFFVMLVIIVIRTCTLKGAGEGLAFLFKPHLDGMDSASDFFSTFKLAGGQMFFSLSLASGCLIAYGSYLGKNENLEKDAAVIAIGDSVVAILAGMWMPGDLYFCLLFGESYHMIMK